MIITVMMSSVVYAATAQEEQAEVVRLYEDMQKFEKRGNWDAVERKYLEILKYKKAKPKHGTHVLAARASDSVGDVGKTRIRLERALEIEEVPETREWLESINNNFVRVEITVSSDYETVPELTPTAMPFFPDQQLAIAFADKQLKATGRFKGMLPLGEYTMGAATFNLQKGMSGVQKIKVTESFAFGGINPRIDIGFSGANAGVSSKEIDSKPFGGYGTRIGAGVSMKIGQQFGVLAQLGYHSAFGANELPGSELVTNLGVETSSTSYNAGFLWLGGSMDFSPVEVTVGPIFEFAKIKTQGLEVTGDVLEYTPAAGALAYAPAVGTVLSGGVAAGLTYYGFKLGALDGGITTQFGAQTDTSRLYSWGQVAFTVNGSKR